MTTNNHQWPSIESLPASIHDLITYKVKVRNNEGKSLQDLATEINAHFTNTTVFAVEKIDGTNLGIDLNGGRFGRRLGIESEVKTYQRTTLSSLANINVRAVYDRIFAVASAQAQNLEAPQIFRLYGELGCNTLYDYKEKGYVGTWQCFGAVLYFSSWDEVEIWRGALTSSGFMIKSADLNKLDEEDEQRPSFTMIECHSFFEILESCQIPHPKFVFSGTLENLILEQKNWMKSHNSEGLVVSTHYEGSNTFTIKKWKQSHEPYQTVGVKLENLIQDPDVFQVLNSAENSKVALTCVNVLLEVAKDKALGRKGKENPAKTHSVNKSSLLILYQEAINSAITKFDSESSYFEQGDSGRSEYIKLLTNEVVSDLGESTDQDEKFKQNIASAIRAFIGKRYGLWLLSNKKK
ncbi:hypothetical protein HK100_005849 [Physocladia obscura]|uniref:Uncharacterized protein n=1 Tax=Physocladia obscura TaxID=109957 RepID=A0AAD5SR63_9FUNG|nr:hypothetical protein HK100_005849 [Physocladia obscura]